MLNEESTNFEASNFFNGCKEELRMIAKQAGMAKMVKKSQRAVESMRSTQRTEQLDRMLLNNIILDYLRSLKLDYTYSIFMRECNMVSEEVASKKMLAQLVDVEK